MRKKILFIAIIVVVASATAGVFISQKQLGIDNEKKEVVVDQDENQVIDNNETNTNAWAQSVMQDMSLEQKIAQLLMIRVYSNKNEEYYKEIDQKIIDYKIGGICFFQGGPITQANLTNRWQKLSEVQMIVSQDSEWGVGMRLKDSVISFPRQMTMGAVADNELIFKTGMQIGKHCKLLGTMMNFAPVADVNSNPKNPVINSRSFGENPNDVAEKSLAITKGMNAIGIMTCAKHFPGHGDTESDSHYSLPVINNTKEYIDSVDFKPFYSLCQNGVDAVMVAHLSVPALDDRKDMITTVSDRVITGILRKQMHFNGLIVTDALDMQGASGVYNTGELELMCLKAGVDILLLPGDLNVVINRIKTAVETGEISEELVDKACERVLSYKSEYNYEKYTPINTEYLYEDLNDNESEQLIKDVYENAITIVCDKNKMLPISGLDTLKIASVSIGFNEQTEFQDVMDRYADVDHFYLPKTFNKYEGDKLINMLNEYNLVIVGIHNTSNWPRYNFGINRNTVDFVHNIEKANNVILDVFCNPYALSRFSRLDANDALIMSYQDNHYAENASAQVIFGGVAAKGSLPVSVDKRFAYGQGVTTEKCRLHYTSFTHLNYNTHNLYRIDTIVENAIKDTVFPGCQILAIKDGEVFLSKAYGYHTYDSIREVKMTDLYDLASVTKIAASTVSLMHLDDKGLFSLDAQLGDYLPYLEGTNKEELLIKDVLTHHAKLKSWIPFYNYWIDNGVKDTDVYSNTYSDEYPYKIADNLYFNKAYTDTIYKWIAETDLYSYRRYKYSDLGFYLMSKIILEQSGLSIDKYADENFYKKLGMGRTLYNPLQKFDKNEIPPQEYDKTFRQQLIHGYVHDQGASLFGGVQGHAGLFSNAYDMGTLLQMLLNKGEYAGDRYLSESVVEEYTKYQYQDAKNRRGAGFDKPIRTGNKQTAYSCSLSSYGHSGFTGTYVWVDPKYDFVYVFLCNRVYTDAENFKIVKRNTRTDIHQILYNTIRY